MREQGERRALPRLARLVYLGATIGFVLGTATLLGPVRWVTAWLRASGVEQGVENLAVRSMIAVLAVATLVLAWKLARRWERAKGRARLGIPAATALVAAGVLLLWLNPRMTSGDAMAATRGDERFVFGPYPTQEDLAELKREGFAGVITLLHPAVAPFEPKLLADEREAARAVGIRLIEAPMLPWISDNRASLDRILRLAAAGEGRFYVHCYLGRDRVNVVRRLVAASEPGAAADSATSRRAIGAALERGPVLRLEEEVYLGPYPTPEEWLGKILNGSVRQVVSLLDPENEDDAPWIQQERTIAARYRVPLEVIPARSFPFDPDAVLEAARRVRSMPHPVFVHAFLTRSPVVQAFAQAYASDLPPLPPALFAEPMERGEVVIAGVNVALGPRPAGREFGGYLGQRGVRGIVYLGGPGDAAAREDRRIVESAGLRWHTRTAADSTLLESISTGGPWYLYGPGLAPARAELERRFDPALPVQ